MSLPKEFYEALPSRPTPEILNALATPADYDPAALHAFEEELRRRQVPVAAIIRQQEASKARQEPVDRRAKEPLSWPVRLICAMLIAIPLIGVVYYMNRGYKRKAREMVEWAFIGFAGYALLGWLVNCVGTHPK